MCACMRVCACVCACVHVSGLTCTTSCCVCVIQHGTFLSPHVCVGKEGGGPSERPWKRYSRTVGRLERGWVEGRSSHQRQGLPHRGASQERQQEEKVITHCICM